jgi:transcriptional regulator with XRE-family HTH domain
VRIARWPVEQADRPPPEDLAQAAPAAQSDAGQELGGASLSPRLKLRQIRERLGMSQRELAATLGQTQARISLMERGNVRVAPELLAAALALESPAKQEAGRAGPQDVARPGEPPAVAPQDPPPAAQLMSISDADLDELAGMNAGEDDGADDAQTHGADL